jgi:hypothetical protein
VKALGEGKVGGYLIVFGDETTPDLSPQRDFFTKATDFDIEQGAQRSTYYSHGLDATMGVKKIGTLTVTDMAKDDHGVWVEAQLKMRDEYEKAIYDMAAKGKLGWSSGAPGHLVTRKAVGDAHEVLTWPIAEGSLTPTPAEPRCGAVALKSLPAMLGIRPPAEDHTTKALPSGMSYDDLRAFLQDELNEDIGDSDDPYGPGLWICDVYDDAVVYRDDEDLYRIPYTVTAGNDAVWGTPESVVRTTVYVTATDGDDDADAAPGMVTQKSLTGGAPAALPFGEHLDAALAAVEGVIARGFDINDLRIKSGRVLSASNRKRLMEMHTQMQTAHAAMGTHIATMQALLNETEPAAKKAADAEMLRFLEFEARALGVAI